MKSLELNSSFIYIKINKNIFKIILAVITRIWYYVFIERC